MRVMTEEEEVAALPAARTTETAEQRVQRGGMLTLLDQARVCHFIATSSTRH